jgi:hypothetical protein
MHEHFAHFMRVARRVVGGCGLFLVVGCSSGGSGTLLDAGRGTGGPTGQSCASASQCYPLVAGLHGTATCLTQGVPNGYCTHTCASDADCCAVSDECPEGYPEVCAPFESTGQTYCFLSCSSSVIGTAPDPTSYCQQRADSAFTCRSTGGGSNNQKFCGP